MIRFFLFLFFAASTFAEMPYALSQKDSPPEAATADSEEEVPPSVQEDDLDPIGTKPQTLPRKQRVEPKNLDTKFRNSLALALDPFRVLILDAHGPVALLGCEVVLEAHNLAQTEIIKACWPKIYSYVFQDLYSVAPFLWETGYTPTRKSLQKRLLRLCQEFFGPGVVEGVIVQKAYLRAMRPKKSSSSRES